MPLGAQLLISATVVLAACLVTHVALLARLFGVMGITTRHRWISLIPVLTPWMGWKHGMRRHVVLWSCLIALYLALRAALALR